MLMRGLLVLLLLLNAGVAAWWALHREPAPRAAFDALAGVPRLQLTDTPNAPTAAAVPAARCYRIGPFADAAALTVARSALAAGVRFSGTAVQLLSPPRGWRVLLAQPSHADAVATAARIGAAGFNDFLVMPDTGPDANSIALGRYGNEAAARARAQALATAGFPASADPVGGREALWLDVFADPSFQPPPAPAPVARAIDCAGVLRDGRYTIPAPA